MTYECTSCCNEFAGLRMPPSCSECGGKVIAQNLAKPAPAVLERDERRAGRETAYRKASKDARKRDGHHCRVCGSLHALETHHVVPRSLVGKAYRDELANLLTACADCHGQFTRHILKIEGPTNANGKLRILKYNKDEGGYVLHVEAA